MTGLSVNAIALVLAAVATHRPGALWTIFAYPVFLVCAWLGFLTWRLLRGWNRLWNRESNVVASGDGPQVNLSLMTTRPANLLTGAGHEIECFVVDPSGIETKASMVSGFYRARVYASYPAMFNGAPKIVPGRYIVIWREQMPAGTGKWRVIDAARVTVTADHIRDSLALAPAPDAPPGQVPA
jgi:hypothetical protein